jgi:hypothetical protein
LGPAHSFAQGATRIAILLVLVPGFFATFGVGIWLGSKWFGGFRGGNRNAGLPLVVLFSIYFLLALVLARFW